MIQLILMLNLAGLNRQTPLALNPQPCVWPNTCSEQAVETVQVQPCVWPNRCSQETFQVAQVQPCVWPNRCSAERFQTL